MKGDEEDFLLLFNHDRKLFFFFSHKLLHLFELGVTLGGLQILALLLVLLDADNVSLDFMFDDPNGGVADLVGKEELVELSEVRVRLEYVE